GVVVVLHGVVLVALHGYQVQNGAEQFFLLVALFFVWLGGVWFLGGVGAVLGGCACFSFGGLF
ncbi:hypothetical protein, partial [Stenotrophomonas maltophilia]|uniref:hypothetical protein n=1 Tax=Stenotrophomonas maltophilia TaxID=40324 RepID=UPI003144ECEC